MKNHYFEMGRKHGKTMITLEQLGMDQEKKVVLARMLEKGLVKIIFYNANSTPLHLKKVEEWAKREFGDAWDKHLHASRYLPIDRAYLFDQEDLSRSGAYY